MSFSPLVSRVRLRRSPGLLKLVPPLSVSKTAITKAPSQYSSVMA